MNTARPSSLAGVVLALGVLLGCGSGDGGRAGGSSVTVVIGSLPPSPTQPSASTTMLPALPPEPTGVPGLDSPTPFCRDYSRLVGSYRVLGVAASFSAADPVSSARLELVASPTLRRAGDALLTAWPAELAGERAAVVEGFVEPLVARAERGLAALSARGVDTTELALLEAAWLEVLAGRDNTTASVELPALPTGLADELDVAAAELTAVREPINTDPSLVSDARATPATDAYLLASCPELGELVGQDAV